MAGVAEDGADGEAHEAVSVATVAQRGVVGSVLWIALPWGGVCRDCRVMVRDLGDRGGVLEDDARRGLAASPVSDMGLLRGCAEFLHLAAEFVIRCENT